MLKSQVNQRYITGTLWVLGMSVSILIAPHARSDYLCTYTHYYMQQDDGSLENYTEALTLGRRFTITLDGKTGGEIAGNFEVYHDGRQEGYAWQGLRESDDSSKYIDPEAYAREQINLTLSRRRQVPTRLWIEEFSDSALKPFMLQSGSLIEAGTCEKI